MVNVCGESVIFRSDFTSVDKSAGLIKCVLSGRQNKVLHKNTQTLDAKGILPPITEKQIPN